MKQKLLNLRALLMVLMMAVGFGHAFAEEVTGKITFSSSAVKINAASVSGADDQNNDWTITTVGTTSFTSNAAYYQVGSSNKPATSITFTTTLPAEQNITSMEAKFGGFSGTAGSVTLKVGDTTVGTGSLNASSDVTVTSTSGASGSVLTVTVTGISKGVKAYYISYTYTEGGDTKTPTTTTFDGEESYEVELGQEFTAPTASVNVEGASVTYSSSKTGVATVDENIGAVTLVGAGTTTITATYAGDDTYASSSASYTITVTKPVPVFESLEALAADETLKSGDIVKVSFQDVEIKSIYVTSKGLRQGIYFNIQKGDQNIEIYYNAEEVPETWIAGGTVSGTMQCPWKLYNTTWELAPDYGTWSWDNLEYTAPAGAKEVATIEFENKSTLEVGASDQYDVTYDGDGTLSVASTNEDVAEVEIIEGQVVVTAKAVGTATITVSATETEEYYAASEQYTLTVTPAKVPFSRDVHKALVAEKDGKFYAAYNTISGSNKYFVIKEVTVSNNKVYGLTDAEAKELAWNVTVDGTEATILNLDNKYLQLQSGNTQSGLSSNPVTLYVDENGYFCYDNTENSRIFAYNASSPRMSSYYKSYPAAVAMAFAAEGEAPTPETANMRITSAQWGTFWAPFAVEIPEGVKAYTGEMRDGWIKMTEVEGIIPARTGVVVTMSADDLDKCEGGVFTADLPAVDSEAAALETCYTGNETGAIISIAQGAYLLQKQEEQVGWYKVMGEGFTLAPNRCYLAADNAESRTFIGFEPVDGDATGISTIASQAATKADGKYMVNGQIVVVKSGKAYNVNGTQVK